jgi:hypothetical protein
MGSAIRRAGALLRAGAGVLLAVALAAPAEAQSPAPQIESDDTEVVVLSGPAHVRSDEVARTVLSFEGPTRVDGRVLEDVVALGGDVSIDGRVDGDVVAVSGRVMLAPGARVGGDIVSSRAPVLGEGAEVGGEVTPLVVPFEVERPLVDWFLASWVSVTASLLVLGLLFFWLIGPRGADAIYESGRRHPLRSTATGLIVAFGIPVVSTIGLLSIIGAPLALMLLFGIALLASVGYLAAAWLLGRWTPELLRVEVTRLPRTAWFLVGFGLLRLVALIPFVRSVSWVVASIVGLGAIVFATWRRRRRALEIEEGPPRPTAPEPVPHSPQPRVPLSSTQ